MQLRLSTSRPKLMRTLIGVATFVALLAAPIAGIWALNLALALQ